MRIRLASSLLGALLFASPSLASQDDLLPSIPATGHKLAFKAGQSKPHLKSGWSVPEDGGIWSDGSESAITLRLTSAPTSDVDLMIDAIAYLALSHLTQQVDLSVNGSFLTTLVFDTSSTADKRVRVPKTLLQNADGQVLVQFKFKNPCTPSAVNLSPDTRTLGIYLRSIMFKQVPLFLADFTTPFEGVVTLGDCCAPKMQVECYFTQLHADKAKDYTGGRNLFDFMVPRRLNLLADAIGNKLEGCCEKTMVVRKAHWESKVRTPVDKYEMNFSHLFDFHPIVKGPTNLTQKLFDKHFEADIQPKIEYLKDKFLNNKRRTLYLMWGVILSNAGDFTEHNIIKLRDTLAAMRGDSNFALLVLCNRNYGFKSRENIRFQVIKAPSGDELHRLTTRFAAEMNKYTFLPVKTDGE